MSHRLRFGCLFAAMMATFPFVIQKSAEAQSLEAIADNLLLRLGYADGSTNMLVAIRNSTGVPLRITINVEQGPRGTFVLQPGESFNGATYWFSQEHWVWLTYGPLDGSAVFMGPVVPVMNSNISRVYFTPNPATIIFDVQGLGNGAVGLNTYTQLQGMIDGQGIIDWDTALPPPITDIVQVAPPPAGTALCSCIYKCYSFEIKPTPLDFLAIPEKCKSTDPDVQRVVRSKCSDPSLVSCQYKP